MANSPVSLLTPVAPPSPRAKQTSRARTVRPTKQEARLLESLHSWQDGRRLGDCPLPELFALAKAAAPRLTIGQFHDAVRSLAVKQAIYLHPWTGPLYEMPQPALALLSGHEVAYYVSLREHLV